MAVIKVADIAYVRLRTPDLDQAEEFLADFGMVRSARSATALYMRGTDPARHLHITERGPSKFLAMAFYAASEADLHKLAKVEGASAVTSIDEPGGGKRVSLTDPNGHRIEVVHGIEPLPPLPVRRNVVNWGDEKYRRKGELTRLPPGPAQVKRIGHGVIMTPELGKSIPWYREVLGLVCSDDVYAGDKSNILASFNRCDRGEDFVDHHVFLNIQGPISGLNHVSFEVRDFDDVMMGHAYLRAKGKYRHVWGIGRHILGSQVYDYWSDPWGRVHEHWTDTDVLNIHAPPNLISAEEGLDSQWGERVPEAFINHATP